MVLDEVISRIEPVRRYVEECDLRTASDDAPGSAGDIAREFVRLVVGEAIPIPLWIDGSWALRLADSLSGVPAPGLEYLIRLLLRRGRLRGEAWTSVRTALNWYPGQWKVFNDILGSKQWQSAALDALVEYSENGRTATFRPYYEDLTIAPELFQEWERTLRPEFGTSLRAASRWRAPYWELRSCADGALPFTSRCSHCGGSWYFQLGNTQHRQFDRSTCFLCVGIDDNGCGAILVDVSD